MLSSSNLVSKIIQNANFFVRNWFDVINVFALLVIALVWTQIDTIPIGGDYSNSFIIWPREWINAYSSGNKLWNGTHEVVLNYQFPYIKLLYAAFPGDDYSAAMHRFFIILSTKLVASYLSFRYVASMINDRFCLNGGVLLSLFSLLYVCSPIVYYDHYFWSLPQHDEIFVYPILLSLFVRFVNANIKLSAVYFIFYAAFFYIFRYCFSPASLPWLLPCIPLIVVLSVYLFNPDKPYKAAKVALLLSASILLIADPLFDDIKLLLNKSSVYTNAISNLEQDGSDRAAASYTGISGLLHIYWSILAQPQFSLLREYSNNSVAELSFPNIVYAIPYIVILFLALIGYALCKFDQPKTYLPMFLLIIYILYAFWHAGGGPFTYLYIKFLGFKGASMWRYPPGKLGFPLLFTFLLFTFYGLSKFVQKFKYNNSIVIVVYILLLPQIIPFANGSIIRQKVWQTDYNSGIKNIDCFEKMSLKLQQDEIKNIASIPLASGDASYHIMSDGKSAIYVGPSLVSMLSGVNVVGSLQMLPGMKEVKKNNDEKYLVKYFKQSHVTHLLIDNNLLSSRLPLNNWLIDFGFNELLYLYSNNIKNFDYTEDMCLNYTLAKIKK